MTIKLNPDETIVKAIRARLKITEGQCPCVQEDLWTPATVCPCEELRYNHYCCCGLYVSDKEGNK